MQDFLSVLFLLNENGRLECTQLIELDGFLKDGASLSLQVLGWGSAFSIRRNGIDSIILSRAARLLLTTDDLHQRSFELRFRVKLRLFLNLFLLGSRLN